MDGYNGELISNTEHAQMSSRRARAPAGAFEGKRVRQRSEEQLECESRAVVCVCVQARLVAISKIKQLPST